jgi:predicted NBD/HSP70 family sugar kinase
MKRAGFEKKSLSERAKKNLAILEAIRRTGPITKAEIAKISGLNLVTISNYIQDFLSKDFVRERALDISSGGRRPILLELNSQAGFVIGVGLNLLNMVGLMVDLRGNIIAEVKKERPNAPVGEIINCLLEIVHEILETSKQDRDKIKGIGVGIAGLMDKKSRTIRWPEKMGSVYASIYMPIPDLLEKEFGLPAYIENDATAAALGEQWLSLEAGCKDIIFMFSGVGCGLIFDGHIYHGASGCAGEVSIHNAKGEDKFNCETGDPCFLKRWEADLGLASLAKKSIAQGRQSRIIEFAEGRLEEITAKHVFEAAKEKDDLAIELISKAAVRLGIKIAYLVNLLNPEVVVLGGGIEQAGPILLETVRDTVNAWAFEETSVPVEITYSKLGDRSVALGAACLVLREIFAQL